MSRIPLVTVHDLAHWIFHKEKVVVLDIRSYREYNTSHIYPALNVGGNRGFKRKLSSNPTALGPLLSSIAGAPQVELLQFKNIVLYDQCSEDGALVTSDDFTNFFITHTAELFPNAVLLNGGFLGFRAAYPQLCWQHPDKLPDEEFVGVNGDPVLDTLLDDCLAKMARSLSPSCMPSSGLRSNSSTRQPSSCSSCGSSSSQQSNDSGVVLGFRTSQDIGSDTSRLSVSRGNSALSPARPPLVTGSFSMDDVTSSGPCARRHSRPRPTTLSSCATHNFSNAVPCSSNTSTSTLHLPLPSSTRPGPPTRSRTYDPTFRSSFASSFQLLSSPPQRRADEDSLLSSHAPYPVSPPPRPLSTVSAALSAEAFESPKPTPVLPHLLLGCQADSVSKQICREYGITHVINVSADGEASPFVPLENFLRIPIIDNGESDIVPFLESAFDFLDAAKAAGGRVLIHCFAGISRSPTLAIAYLMKTQKMTFDEAYNRVRAIRPKISPNFNFVGQLMAFQERLQLSPTAAPCEALPSPLRMTTEVEPAQHISPCVSPVPTTPSIYRPPTFLITPSLVPVVSSMPPQTQIHFNPPAPSMHWGSCAHLSRDNPTKRISQSYTDTLQQQHHLQPQMDCAPLPNSSKPATSPLKLLSKANADSITKYSPTTIGTLPSTASRPASLLVRRPTQKSDYSPLPLLTGCTTTSKKRDRPQHLSLHSSPPSSSEQCSVQNSIPTIGCVCDSTPSVIVVGRLKRSRFAPTLLPSPSTAIASLDLSSPSEDWRMRTNDPPPPPPSPRPRRLRRFMYEDNDATRRFSMSVFPERRKPHHQQQQRFSVFEPLSSDIDSDVDMNGMSASNPTIQSPASRWPTSGNESSCRHQQATAESSCHSSLSSSSNGQHTTPSFPIS